MSIRPLSTEVQQIAETVCNEVPTRVEEDIKHIREWLQHQPHLTARTDDQWVLSFLRGCKFSLERTKEKMDMFYTMKTALPEFFSNRDPFLPEIQEILNSGAILPLSINENSTEPFAILIRYENVDPSKISSINMIKTGLMIVDILLHEEESLTTVGQQVFIDLKAMTLNHVLQLTPDICKKLIVCAQDSYPSRLKGIHYINAPIIFEAIFYMVKSLLTDKLKKRIHLSTHDSFNVYSNISVSMLPEEYGGNGETLQDLKEKWKQKVESYRDWLLADEKCCADESKRPGKSKTFNELFGFEGSFRKLAVD